MWELKLFRFFASFKEVSVEGKPDNTGTIWEWQEGGVSEGVFLLSVGREEHDSRGFGAGRGNKVIVIIDYFVH